MSTRVAMSLMILKKFAAGAGEKIASAGRHRFFRALPVAYGVMRPSKLHAGWSGRPAWRAGALDFGRALWQRPSRPAGARADYQFTSNVS